MNASIDWNSLVEQHSQTNPKFKMLHQLMQQQAQSKPEPKSKVQGQLRKLVHINESLVKKNKRLERQQKHLLKYLNFFIDVNTVFSSAVGACECWGEDQSCQLCHGKGQPGFFEVDENAFRTYVLPCMDKVSESQETFAKRANLENIPNN